MEQKKMSPTHLDAKALSARWYVRPDTLRHWVRQGAIPSGIRLGRKRIWTLDEIEEHERKMRKSVKP